MRQMKDSGVEWIGEIPLDWDVTTYRRLLKRRKEYDDKEKQVLSLTVQGVKQKNESYGKMAEDFTGHQIVKKDDLVFTPRDFDATPILSGISPCDGCISNLYFVLYPHDTTKIHLPFYNFFMWGVKWGGDIWRKLSYGMRFSYNFQQFGDLPTVLPPLETQRRIADYLDEKCAKIDTIIAKQQEVIEKLKEYKLAVITEAVTKGLNPDVPMKDSGVEWIGEIPEHWETYRIANLYDEISENGNDELPILTVSINSGVSDRELSDEESERVFVRSEDKSKYKRVQPGDLTYNMMRAWQGAFGAVRVDGMVSPAYIVARPKNNIKIDSRYIEYLMRTPIATEEMHRYSHGIADFRLRLYWPQFKNIRICLPDHKEQVIIADFIDKKIRMIDSTIEKITDKIYGITEYKKALIYEVVTGKREV